MDRVEQGSDLRDFEARERDAQGGPARGDEADLVRVEQMLAQLVGIHAEHLDQHEVAAVERVHVPAGSEARVENLSVLRVSRPEILKELRNSKAAKFLGESLGPTAVVVKSGAMEKVRAALAELGVFAEMGP